MISGLPQASFLFLSQCALPWEAHWTISGGAELQWAAALAVPQYEAPHPYAHEHPPTWLRSFLQGLLVRSGWVGGPEVQAAPVLHSTLVPAAWKLLGPTSPVNPGHPTPPGATPALSSMCHCVF